jgi:hypothetical protein
MHRVEVLPDRFVSYSTKKEKHYYNILNYLTSSYHSHFTQPRHDHTIKPQ